MKKFFALVLSLISVLSALAINATATEATYDFNTKTEDIFVRDPYVLSYDGLYYMYGTGLATTAGYGCRVSKDLENWSQPYNVFVASADFDGDECFWAPECHFYNDSFYLFATYKSKTTGYRGTSVFRADNPLGPFVEISDGHITPHNSDNIDGTLYIDEDGQPWMAYVCEWTSTDDGIGKMAVAKLSDDLSEMISEPREIFSAHDAPWCASVVTDGPFLYKTSNGSLLMLWSTVSHEGYCVGIARSSNGKINGKWTQELTRVYSRSFQLDKNNASDGGHPMLFSTFDGTLMMAMHSPNASENGVFEHAIFYEMEEKYDTLRIEEFYCINRFIDTITTIFNRISDVFEDLFGL